MRNDLLHTPEGVRDTYGIECAKKETIRNNIMNVFHLYGFNDIQTPMFEFFDIFAKERGSVLSKDMFKFFDKSGNTLVLRPDITPSIARSVAKYYANEDMPVRLCYCGNTFINHDSLLGHMKEVTQMGAELVGDETSDADAEMLAALIECLQTSGLKEFTVEVGHVAFMNNLLNGLKISDEALDELYSLIEAKNFFGVDELLAQANVDENTRAIFQKLFECFGSIEKIAEIKKVTDREDLIAPISYLEKLYEILKMYHKEQYISFDLSKLGRYQYYTGIIFQGYTYKTGDVICTGGRYDNLLKQFGKIAPSVGFAIHLDQLMLALSRQNIPVSIRDAHCVLVYERTQKEKAIDYAIKLRKDEKAVQMMKRFKEKSLEDYISLAKRFHAQGVIYINDDGEISTIYTA